MKAATAQRSRTRALARSVQHTGPAADADGRAARQRRIRTAKRDVDRALRARVLHQESVRAADTAAGDAVRRLLAEGLSAADAAALTGLTRSQIKRLLRVAADPPEATAAVPSTAQAALVADPAAGAHIAGTGTRVPTPTERTP